jgi:hypothetical protein
VGLENRAEATYAEYQRQKAIALGGRGFRLLFADGDAYPRFALCNRGGNSSTQQFAKVVQTAAVKQFSTIAD